MNYFEYGNHLVKKLALKKAETQQMYENISAAEDPLTSFDANLYLENVRQCNHIANLAESVMKAVLSGEASPFDEID